MSLFVSNLLIDSISRLDFFEKVFEKQIKNPKEDFKFELYKTNLKETYMDLINSLSECKYITSSSLVSMADSLISLLEISKDKLFNSITEEEYLDAIKLCNKIVKSFDVKMVQNKNRYDYCYDYFDNRKNFCFEREFFNTLQKSIKIPNRHLKILNAYTRYGYEGEFFKKSMPDECYELYGIDINQDIDDCNKLYYNRILYGDLKGSFISNDVFDICFYSSPIQIEQNRTFNGTFNKKEKTFLQKVIQYIRKDGYLILNIPKFRLAKDICSILARNFKDFFLIKNDMNNIDNIYIIAKKKSVKTDINIDDYCMLRYYIDDYAKSLKECVFDENSTFSYEFVLPKTEIDLKQFRGSIIDESEIESLYRKSSCTSSFWQDQNSNMLEEEKIPLLPFNAGQIGLILTSGFLDGIIDEGDGFYHVVKGRTVKKTDGNDEIHAESNCVEVTEITSNRVEINVFLPDGTFKKLA